MRSGGSRFVGSSGMRPINLEYVSERYTNPLTCLYVAGSPLLTLLILTRFVVALARSRFDCFVQSRQSDNYNERERWRWDGGDGRPLQPNMFDAIFFLASLRSDSWRSFLCCFPYVSHSF